MGGESSRRFRLTVAYDGRGFEGWQSQAGGNTIQDHLLAALREIAPEISTVQGAGRTDAGVSALGQAAHFDAPPSSSMSAESWLKALNTKLPPTIRIQGCESVDPEFHARFSAIDKTYRYRIWTGAVLPPLDYGLAWHLAGFEPRTGFGEALARFEGTHDFRAFSANRRDGLDGQRDTRRTLARIDVTGKSDSILVTLTGDGFLYKMVRFLVGTAVWAARGKVELEDIEELLTEPDDRTKAPFCAPPEGLYLVNVRYSR